MTDKPCRIEGCEDCTPHLGKHSVLCQYHMNEFLKSDIHSLQDYIKSFKPHYLGGQTIEE